MKSIDDLFKTKIFSYCEHYLNLKVVLTHFVISA